MEDEFLNSLKIKEKEIRVKLEESPLFRQLESLRGTISAFESNSNSITTNVQKNENILPENISYDASNFTWRERVLFVVRNKELAGVADIISEIQKLEQNNYTKAFLDKRIGVTVSQLKRKGELDSKVDGKKNKYFIK